MYGQKRGKYAWIIIQYHAHFWTQDPICMPLTWNAIKISTVNLSLHSRRWWHHNLSLFVSDNMGKSREFLINIIFTVDELHPNSCHYNDVIIKAMASQVTSITSAYSTVYSGADQRKHQSTASLTFVRGIHRWPVNSPHKGPITGKCFHLRTSSYRSHSFPW